MEKQLDKNRLAQKLKARHLILNKGYSLKEAAKEVGVSQNTMTTWNKKYKWQEKLITGNQPDFVLPIQLDAFMNFLKLSNSKFHKGLAKQWELFLAQQISKS